MDAKPIRLASWLNDARAEMLSFVPTEVGNHLAAAKKELLAAARSVIDEEMAWTDRRWEAAKAKRADRRARASEETGGEQATRGAKATK